MTGISWTAMVRRIFAFEGDGKVVQYEGGFTDYQAAYLMKHPELSGGTAGGKGAAGRDSTGNAGAADGDSESGGAAKKIFPGGKSSPEEAEIFIQGAAGVGHYRWTRLQVWKQISRHWMVRSRSPLPITAG